MVIPIVRGLFLNPRPTISNPGRLYPAVTKSIAILRVGHLKIRTYVATGILVEAGWGNPRSPGNLSAGYRIAGITRFQRRADWRRGAD